MRFRYTRHARGKFKKIKKAGYSVKRKQVEQTIINPARVEQKSDELFIAMTLLDEKHVLRVVYRFENDIIVIITFYPGRRKSYEI